MAFGQSLALGTFRLVRRLALLSEDHPLALSEHRYLGHRFRLDVEFRGRPGAAAPETPGMTL